jgi:hypothetical protein
LRGDRFVVGAVTGTPADGQMSAMKARSSAIFISLIATFVGPLHSNTNFKTTPISLMI